MVDPTHRLYILRVLRSSAPFAIIFDSYKPNTITRRDAHTCSAPQVSYGIVINQFLLHIRSTGRILNQLSANVPATLTKQLT